MVIIHTLLVLQKNMRPSSKIEVKSQERDSEATFPSVFSPPGSGPISNPGQSSFKSLFEILKNHFKLSEKRRVLKTNHQQVALRSAPSIQLKSKPPLLFLKHPGNDLYACSWLVVMPLTVICLVWALARCSRSQPDPHQRPPPPPPFLLFQHE